MIRVHEIHEGTIPYRSLRLQSNLKAKKKKESSYS